MYPPTDYYYYPDPQICNDPPPCELKCGLVANLNTYVSNPRESLAEHWYGKEYFCQIDENKKELQIKIEDEQKGIIKISIYNSIGSIIKNIEFSKDQKNISCSFDLNEITNGIYFTTILINNTIKHTKIFNLIK